MRLSRLGQVIVLTVLMIPVVATTAAAETVDVTMQDDFFDPDSVVVALGDEVRWTNQGAEFHDTKSAETNPDGSEGVAWWDSPDVTPVVGTFSWTFTAAGTFPYYCTLHEGMAGTVTVVPKVQPPVGGMDTDIVVRVGINDEDQDLVYDVQKRDPGASAFRDWRRGVRSGKVSFDPPSVGTYQFRSRLRRMSTGGASLYSDPTDLVAVRHFEEVSTARGVFTPPEVTVPLGGGVLWGGPNNHTTTSFRTNPDGTSGIALWDGPLDRGGPDFAYRFTASGAFPYYCRRHPVGMRGTVWVPVRIAPGGGGVGDVVQIRVATERAARGFVYDIQKWDPGGGFFEDWKLGVAGHRASFRPQEPGTYRFRSRLRRLSTGGVSLYSMPASIRVTSAPAGPSEGQPAALRRA